MGSVECLEHLCRALSVFAPEQVKLRVTCARFIEWLWAGGKCRRCGWPEVERVSEGYYCFWHGSWKTWVRRLPDGRWAGVEVHTPLAPFVLELVGEISDRWL